MLDWQVINKCHEQWKKLLDGAAKPGRKWVPGHVSLREKTFAMIKPCAVKHGFVDEAPSFVRKTMVVEIRIPKNALDSVAFMILVDCRPRSLSAL